MSDIKTSVIRQELQEIKALDLLKVNEKLDLLNEFIPKYTSDERNAVIKLVESANKLRDTLTEEIDRIKRMKKYDLSCGEEYQYICGVDEVGRGPLAGPILTAAVILPRDVIIPYVNDSKQVKKELREKLYEEITARAVSWAIGIREASFIDSDGIVKADAMAMRDAVLGLEIKPDIILVDAFEIPEVDIPERAIIKGDANSMAIAAASIVAKVTRDRIMEEYGAKYPEYGFEKNSGYGTKQHTDALQEIGPCPIHRRSFITKYL